MSLLKTMPSQRSELPLMTFARKVKPHNVYYMSYGACCNTLTQKCMYSSFLCHSSIYCASHCSLDWPAFESVCCKRQYTDMV